MRMRGAAWTGNGPFHRCAAWRAILCSGRGNSRRIRSTGNPMTTTHDTPAQSTCPECHGDNLYAHGGVNARGGYGPDLLPGASGVFASAKMRSVVCRDCGLVRFYAGNEALARITPENGWRKTR